MYDFSSKTTVLSTGFENFLKQNKKEAELVKQLKTKLKAFSEVLHSQIKNYVDEEKVVNISSLEKEKNVLMVFIKQHFQEFKVLYVFFILSML